MPGCVGVVVDVARSGPCCKVVVDVVAYTMDVGVVVVGDDVAIAASADADTCCIVRKREDHLVLNDYGFNKKRWRERCLLISY